MIIPTAEFGRWPHWADDKSWDKFLRGKKQMKIQQKMKYLKKKKKRLLWDLCDSSLYHHLYPTTRVKSALHYPLRTSETSEYFRLSCPGVLNCTESGTVLKSKRFLRGINKTKENKRKKKRKMKIRSWENRDSLVMQKRTQTWKEPQLLYFLCLINQTMLISLLLYSQSRNIK